MSKVYAGVEAGGTKFVCAVGRADEIVDQTVVATTTPERTLDAVSRFFATARGHGLDIEALGVASFGPLDLRPQSPSYGTITTTTKPGWADTDLLGILATGLGVAATIDTDVNGAAYGEHRWGAAADVDSSVYLTIGTGIGGGAVVDGALLHGAMHPEMGHLPVRRHPDDTFDGCCPFHGDCIEGLASGPAIAARTGRPATALGDQLAHIVTLQAWYLAQLTCSVTYLLSPQRIVLGGGVSQLPGLLAAVRAQTVAQLAGALPGVSSRIDDYLVAPGLGSRSGVLGALGLAEDLSHPRQRQAAQLRPDRRCPV